MPQEDSNPDEPSQLQLQPHPVLEQLPGIQYCVNSPPPWIEAVVLGFQHYILAQGSIVMISSIIISQMGGSDKDKVHVIQTLVLVSGINTLLHSFFGTRLPSVIGGSYAFLIPVTSIIYSGRYQSINPPELRFLQMMREIQGALILASCFQMVIGFIGLWRNILRILSPLSMVPLVCFTGLGLYNLTFPLIGKCVAVGLPELVIIIFISQYLPRFLKLKRPLCDRFAFLSSVAIVSVYAEILTASGVYKTSKNGDCANTSRLIKAASWFYIPYPFQWGPPSFSARAMFAAIASSFVASVESTGSFIAAARYGKATPVPPSVISRGIGWLGFATFLNAVFGCVTGSTVLVENAGLLAMTKAGSRRVVQISSVFMIMFSIFGKFGAVFASIPPSIIAASYSVFFGFVSSAGLGFLQFCNLNSFRTKLILGLSFMIGLSLPQYYRDEQHITTTWFGDMWDVIVTSNATVAAAVALLLDCTLPEEPDGAVVHHDNGSYWWAKFMVYNKDVRNNEFYKLPGRLNNCFPSL